MEDIVNSICGILDEQNEILMRKTRVKALDVTSDVRTSFKRLQFYLYGKGRVQFPDIDDRDLFAILIDSRMWKVKETKSIWKPWHKITPEELEALQTREAKFNDLYQQFSLFIPHNN
jgi:hypothetical protein